MTLQGVQQRTLPFPPVCIVFTDVFTVDTHDEIAPAGAAGPQPAPPRPELLSQRPCEKGWGPISSSC